MVFSEEQSNANSNEDVQDSSVDVQEQDIAKNPNFKWYVVHVYSGYEQRVKESLLERIKSLSAEENFGEVLIPTENVVEMVQGQKKSSKRKFFPGYILVQMDLTDDMWHLVKGTPKVTGFVGGASRRPTPVPEKEVLRLTQQISEGVVNPKLKMSFEKGENVRVVEGPFQNFNGVVDEVKPDKGKLRVLVSIFGRSTPVELDYAQVEKS